MDTLVFISFLPIIIFLALVAVGIYFIMKVVHFMNVKMKLDQERNEKLDEIIKNMKDK